MKLGKPPVVEASVQFHFESPPGGPEWDVPLAFEFSERFRVDYAETEVASHEQLEQVVKKFARGARQPVFVPKRVNVALRSYPPDRSRYMVVAKDLLHCIHLRSKDGDYLGFDALKADALNKLENYVDYFRPAKLMRFVVGYVDYFRVPTQGGKANLSDYFAICSEPQEDVFGTTVSFRKGFTTRVSGSDDIMTCELYNAPKTPGSGISGIPFRMEWWLHAFKGVSWEPGALTPRLDEAHAHLLKCFRASFTATGWALFDPENPSEGPS